jgi:succinate dehydrogenase / fumarate reductase cytochrome b subunit
MTTVSRPAPRPSLARSLIGMKVIMAGSGVILFVFVVGHLLGNLKVYQGAAHFNAYAEGLRTVGAPFFGRGQLLWAIRVVLLAALGAHLWAAFAVTRASWRARPIGYHQLTPVETTYAARSMRWGGVLILGYVVYHLLDLSFGPANPRFVPGDAYHNLVASLARWPVAAAYGFAMLAVGLHLYHGLWSAGQTLGLNRPPTSAWRRGSAALIAGLITVGYLSIPVAVLSGLVR